MLVLRDWPAVPWLVLRCGFGCLAQLELSSVQQGAGPEEARRCRWGLRGHVIFHTLIVLIFFSFNIRGMCGMPGVYLARLTFFGSVGVACGNCCLPSAGAVEQGAGAEEEADRCGVRRLEQEGLPRLRCRHRAPRTVSMMMMMMSLIRR